jgi:type III secretory pathway lipoprotein EscJ
MKSSHVLNIDCVKVFFFISLLLLIGCSTAPILVPVASVHYDGFEEGREIIATLGAHGIPACPTDEATVVFPILVPKSKFEVAVSILRTNAFVTSGKVRLYTNITWTVKSKER